MKKEKIRKSPSISQRDLAKIMAKRQEIISKAKDLKKTAKSARKRQEKIQHHKQKATSTKIRENNKDKPDGTKQTQSKSKKFKPVVSFSDEQKNKKDEKKIKPKMYSVSFWEENEDEDD